VGHTPMRTLAAIMVLVGLIVYLSFGTLSPCGVLRQTVRQHDNMAAALPDALVDLALSAQYGELSPGRCLGVLIDNGLKSLNKTAPTPKSAPIATTPIPQQPIIQQMPSGDEVLKAATKAADAAISECRARRLSGELKTYVASAHCANPRIMQAYGAANYRYMDLIALLTAKRLEVAEKLDRHQLTEIQAQAENTKVFTEIVEAERRRDNAGRQ
jgi:hypothetical protein